MFQWQERDAHSQAVNKTYLRFKDRGAVGNRYIDSRGLGPSGLHSEKAKDNQVSCNKKLVKLNILQSLILLS